MIQPAVQLRLAPQVHMVLVGDDLVVLDAGADTYFCLAGAARVVEVEADGRVLLRDDATEAALREAGLIEVGPAARRERPDLPRRTGPPPRSDRRPPLTAVLTMIWAGIATELAFRRQSFAQILTWAGAGRDAAARPIASPRLLASVAEFSAVRPWLPFDGACLKRSYMLLRYLRLRGHDADWVVAVRTWPFVAHCWLQVEDQVLDDDIERLAAYRPILVA